MQEVAGSESIRIQRTCLMCLGGLVLVGWLLRPEFTKYDFSFCTILSILVVHRFALASTSKQVESHGFPCAPSDLASLSFQGSLSICLKDGSFEVV